MMSISLILSILIHFEDKRSKNILNYSDEQKEIIKDDSKVKYDEIKTNDSEDIKVKKDEASTIDFSKANTVKTIK